MILPQGGLTALHLACRYGGVEAVRVLLDSGADFEARDDVRLGGASSDWPALAIRVRCAQGKRRPRSGVGWAGEAKLALARREGPAFHCSSLGSPCSALCALAAKLDATS